MAGHKWPGQEGLRLFQAEVPYHTTRSVSGVRLNGGVETEINGGVRARIKVYVLFLET